ncbi:MAG: hypothetical protein H7336_02275 [Bacteriovorax sp.]|nr:hypothetical protein [Bacteriovorax sp.]
MKKTKYIFLASLIIILYSCGGSSSAGSSDGTYSGANSYTDRAFPVDNPWNQDISNAPLDPNSDIYISSMGRTGTVHPDFGTWWDGAALGQPVNTVSGSQTKVPVTFSYGRESDPGPYPIPANAEIQGGPNGTGDRHLIVIDKDRGILYEMYQAYQNGDGSWRAESGAKFNLNTNELRPAGYTSADAAGLPIYPGLVRYEEVVVKKEINHALRFTANQTRHAYVYPARHAAGNSTSTALPPMGMRVRLKAGYDISAYPESVQVILRTLKKYGMILADNGNSWMLSGIPNENWNDSELHTIKQVPGSAFEVVKMGEVQY